MDAIITNFADAQTLTIILGVLLAISEALSLIPSVKANGIFQAVSALLKRLAGKSAVAILLCLSLIACSGASLVVVNLVAQDVGYFGYRLVPEARPALLALCALTGDDAAVTESATTDLLGRVWTAANTEIGNEVCRKINQLVGQLKQYADSKMANIEVVAYCRGIVEQVCAGVVMAQGA